MSKVNLKFVKCQTPNVKKQFTKCNLSKNHFTRSKMSKKIYNCQMSDVKKFVFSLKKNKCRGQLISEILLKILKR